MAKEFFKSKKQIRVLIVDNSAMLRDGLTKLIDSDDDLKVCGKVSDINVAFQNINELKPDVVLTDLFFKESSGVNFIKKITKKYNGLAVLVISMLDELIYGELALRSGAMGYIMKGKSGETLIKGIKTVIKGNKFVSESVVQKMMDNLIGHQREDKLSPINNLTNREFEILNMIGNCMDTRQIAKKLSISVQTIESHRLNIKKKLSLRNSAELIQYAIKWVLTMKM